MKFRVGDTVIVTGGKDKGKQGKVLRVSPTDSTVVVQGVNMYTRHFKPMMGQAGRRERKERALPTAKIALFNPDTKAADRVGYKIEDGKKVRFFKKTGKTV
jgi:large subunit ribosomal protein L24